MATLSDVARLAGVSLSTASRALNGSRDRVVNPELAAKALAAARELNYVPNAAAQTMARGRSNVIALIVNDIRDPYFSSIAAGVMRSAHAAGCIVTLSSIANDRQALVPLIDALRPQRPEALILAGSLWDEPSYVADVGRALSLFQESTGASVCAIGHTKLGFPAVTAQNRSGAAALGAGLAERGFRTAAVLAGPASHLTALKRTQGFREGFAGPGQVVRQVHSDFTRDGGYEAMRTVVTAARLPEVVFAANDVMAIGALAAAREAGLRVPQDIGLAGFDDIPNLLDVTPALTTVRVPLDLLGTTALDMVLNQGDEAGADVHLSTTPVFRESTDRA